MTAEITYPWDDPRQDDLEADRITRWQPSPTSVERARKLLASEPADAVAVIPMYQPGKEHGWWTMGQQVETVEGVVFVAVNSFDPTDTLPSLSWARDQADLIAATFLRVATGGTTAYAYVTADSDQTPVFEGMHEATR